MPVLPNFIYRLNIISVKIPESYLIDKSWQTDSKVYTEKQKILHNQHKYRRTKLKDSRYLITKFTIRL